MRKATTQDVAKLAGVSVGTVSKYVNGGKLGPKTHEKVKEAIDVLGFVPNTLARNLAKGKSYTIVLFIIAESPIRTSTWLHELSIIQGATDVAKEAGYSLKIEIATVENEAENLEIINSYTSSKRIDGMILLSPWFISENILINLKYHDFPYIMIGRSSEDCECYSIDFDNSTPVYEIVRHLYEQGHRKFGMIAGFQTQMHTRLREQGFRDGLRDSGIEVSDSAVRYCDYSLEGGFNVANEIFDSGDWPTAFICGNDYIAAGAVKAALNHGLQIPKDVAVSGFDATVVADAVSPSITTVEVPAYEMGSMAMCELLMRMKTPEYKFDRRDIPSKVIYKNSTENEKEQTNGKSDKKENF